MNISFKRSDLCRVQEKNCKRGGDIRDFEPTMLAELQGVEY
jgi:hypothetical protein